MTQNEKAYKLALMLAVDATTEKKLKIALAMASDLQSKITAENGQKIREQIELLVNAPAEIYSAVMLDLVADLAPAIDA
tara:strand:- start:1067 stop:1303 length:237 start_codon:yes stop_codon:yes gene_type:complete